MYVSLSSPGAEFFRVDTIVSSSCGVKGRSVSACSIFVRYIECSLSGCCFSSGEVVWFFVCFFFRVDYFRLGRFTLDFFNLAPNLHQANVPKLFAPTVKLVLFNCLKSSSHFSLSCS